MNSIKVCEYSRSRSFYDDLILQDQASGERSQDQWSSGVNVLPEILIMNQSQMSFQDWEIIPIVTNLKSHWPI